MMIAAGMTRAYRQGVAIATIVGLATALSLVTGAPSAGAAAPPPPPPPGSVLAWGDGGVGNLGNGSTANSSLPVAVSLPAHTVVTSVASHHFDSLALTSTGSVLTWGSGTDGALGNGGTADRDVPVAVHLPAGTVATSIASGHYFGLAATAKGAVYAWGYNGYGELGDNTTTNSDVPVAVHLPAGVRVTQVSAGHDTSYALTSTGKVYAWGYGEDGEMGNNTTSGSDVPVAVDLPAGVTVRSIAAQAYTGMALTSTAKIYGWGYNGDGELADNTTTDSHVPVLAHLPAGVVVTAIAAGHYNGLAVTSSGHVYEWGYNSNGQVGNGTTTEQVLPVAVEIPAGVDVVAVAASGYHGLALTSTGQMYAWGYNGDGELGDGTTTSSDVPVKVHLPAGARVSAIAAGNYFSLAVLSPPPTPPGYWLVASDGGVFNFGVPLFGSLGGVHLNQPIVGMAATADNGGYWLVARDGGIFQSGDAKFYGSTGAVHLNQPIVGMAADPATGGYWLVAADGGVFNFNAPLYGSLGNVHLNQPIVGMAATPDGGGYWLVAKDGGVFQFGNAKFYGSTGGIHLNQPVVGMAADAATHGYWLVAADGGIFNFNAPFLGSTGGIHLNQPVVGMAAAPSGGYWLVASDGGIFNFNAPFLGSTGGIHLNQPIVGMAGT